MDTRSHTQSYERWENKTMTTRKNRMTTKQRVTAIVAAGGLAAGSATAFAATHTGGTTATAATTSASAAAAATPGPGEAPPGSGGVGSGGPGGPGGALTITGVSGRTILARDGSGRTITVRVGATTTYSEAGARTTLSDLRAGEQIAVQASGSTARATTLTATRVTIILPQVMGRVTVVARGWFTVAGFNGSTITVKTTAATRYVKASGAVASASTLKKGAAIMAEGALVGNGKTFTAWRVTIGVSATGPGSAPNGGAPPGGTGGAPPPSGTPGA